MKPATFDRRPLRLMLEPFKVGPKLAEVGVNNPQKVHFERVAKKRLMKKKSVQCTIICGVESKPSLYIVSSKKINVVAEFRKKTPSREIYT